MLVLAPGESPGAFVHGHPMNRDVAPTDRPPIIDGGLRRDEVSRETSSGLQNLQRAIVTNSSDAWLFRSLRLCRECRVFLIAR